jgi:hypothetical protein
MFKASRAKFFGRTGTRSKFGKTPERALPDPKEESTSIEDQDPNAEKKEKEKTDAEIESSEDKTEQEKSGASTSKKGKTVVRKNIASDKVGTSSKSNVADIFTTFWATVLPHSLIPVTFSDHVWFVPNAIGLITICNIFFPLVGRSNWIDKHEPTFIPYAAATAICYLYYIQILRAKEAAGALDGNETSILTRFRKCFPEEKIIIPGIFVPFFESIVSTEPSDNKYPWIVPHYGDLTSFTGFDHFHDAGAINFIRPLVPLMLANLASFGAVAPANLAGRMVNGEVYHPIDLHPANGANNRRTLNQVFDFSVAAGPVPAVMTDEMAVFAMSGMNVPFEFFNDNVAAAQRHLRRSNFFGARGIDFSVINGQTFDGQNLNQTRNCNTIETFLVAEKNKSLHWADFIFDQLAIAAKHSNGNRNLSEIATTGGMESTVLCSLRTGTRHAINAVNRYVYADTHLGVANSAGVDWYMTRQLSDLTGYFATSRADIERNEELQAFAFGINAIPPIDGVNRRTDGYVSGSFFTHAINAGGAEDAMVYAEHGNDSDTVPGAVDMYQGWEQNIIRPHFLNKPTGM